MAKLYFRHGSMASGKTLMLLAVAHAYEQQGKKVLVVKPSMDTRFQKELVKSRSGFQREADFLAETDSVFPIELLDNKSCVLVDEAQFLSSQFVDQLRQVSIEKDVPIICYGLRTDFQTKLFEGSRRLMELADNIEEIKTTCHYCNRKGIFNMRIVGDKAVFAGNQIQLGTEESYRSACAQCYQSHRKSSESQNLAGSGSVGLSGSLSATLSKSLMLLLSILTLGCQTKNQHPVNAQFAKSEVTLSGVCLVDRGGLGHSPNVTFDAVANALRNGLMPTKGVYTQANPFAFLISVSLAQNPSLVVSTPLKTHKILQAYTLSTELLHALKTPPPLTLLAASFASSEVPIYTNMFLDSLKSNRERFKGTREIFALQFLMYLDFLKSFNFAVGSDPSDLMVSADSLEKAWVAFSQSLTVSSQEFLEAFFYPETRVDIWERLFSLSKETLFTGVEVIEDDNPLQSPAAYRKIAKILMAKSPALSSDVLAQLSSRLTLSLEEHGHLHGIPKKNLGQNQTSALHTQNWKLPNPILLRIYHDKLSRGELPGQHLESAFVLAQWADTYLGTPQLVPKPGTAFWIATLSGFNGLIWDPTKVPGENRRLESHCKDLQILDANFY